MGGLACSCCANRIKHGGLSDVAPNGAGELGGYALLSGCRPEQGYTDVAPIGAFCEFCGKLSAAGVKISETVL